MTSPFNSIDNIGFRRDALLEFLAQGGVDLSSSIEASPGAAPVPDWATACRAVRRFTLQGAARALTGVDPFSNEWFGEEWQSELYAAQVALSQAVEDGDITPCIQGNSDQPSHYNAADLRDWALSHGYAWPIPELNSVTGIATVVAAGGVGDDVLKRLQESECERNELQAEVERLKAEAKQLTNQSVVLAEQAAQLGALEAANRKSQVEIARLQTEIAKGKSLSTLQKLLIAMAIDGYGYKPGDGKSPIPKQIEGVTIGLEIEVTDETVLRHLKLAAETHLPGTSV